MVAPKLPPLGNKGTTRIGYKNRNGLTVIRATDQSGNDHNQKVYVLRCEAGHELGANGSDIHLRVCKYCDPSAKGKDLLVEA